MRTINTNLIVYSSLTPFTHLSSNKRDLELQSRCPTRAFAPVLPLLRPESKIPPVRTDRVPRPHHHPSHTTRPTFFNLIMSRISAFVWSKIVARRLLDWLRFSKAFARNNPVVKSERAIVQRYIVGARQKAQNVIACIFSF